MAAAWKLATLTRLREHLRTENQRKRQASPRCISPKFCNIKSGKSHGMIRLARRANALFGPSGVVKKVGGDQCDEQVEGDYPTKVRCSGLWMVGRNEAKLLGTLLGATA
jgi:hypothetical protein